MKQYLEFLDYITKKGNYKSDRTKTGTISCFGYQMRFDLNEGFPLVTTKKTFLKGIIHELLWFIKGDTNIRYLVLNGVNIWNDWPYKKYCNSKEYQNETMEEYIAKIKEDKEFSKVWGELGPVYGYQWRNFLGHEKSIDQLTTVIDEIKNNPNSRRLIVSSWHPAYLEQMALPPCHMVYQFYVNDNKLNCQLYQRSADAFLGVPFNIASYSLLTMMVATVCNLEVGEFIHTFGDCHIYCNHLEQVQTQLKREPLPLPQMKIKKRSSIEDFVYEDFELVNYKYHEALKGKISV